jgi:hypothetical protein
MFSKSLVTLVALATVAGTLPATPASADPRNCTPVAFRQAVDLALHFGSASPSGAASAVTILRTAADGRPTAVRVAALPKPLVYIDPSIQDYKEVYLQAHGLASLPDGFDVDHVYNAGSAKGRYGLVRIEAIDADVNRMTGAIWESRRSRMNRAAREAAAPPSTRKSVVCADPFQRIKLRAQIGVSRGDVEIPVSIEVEEEYRTKDGKTGRRIRREIHMASASEFDQLKTAARQHGVKLRQLRFRRVAGAIGKGIWGTALDLPVGSRAFAALCTGLGGASVTIAAEAAAATVGVKFGEGINRSEIAPGRTVGDGLGDVLRQGVGDAALLTLNDAEKQITCAVRPITDATAQALLAAQPVLDAAGNGVEAGQDALAQFVVDLAGADTVLGVDAAVRAGIDWFNTNVPAAGETTADAIGAITKAAYEISQQEGGYVSELLRFYGLGRRWDQLWADERADARRPR